MNANESMYAPVEKLSVELLSYIFELRLSLDKAERSSLPIWKRRPSPTLFKKRRQVEEYEDKGPGCNGGDTKKAILCLPSQIIASHVCKHWREIALSTASLWSELKFIDHSPEYSKTKAFIARSKEFPLDIHINGAFPQWSKLTPLFETKMRPILESALSLIIPHVSRWKSFNFNTSCFCHIPTMMEQLASLPSAPLLETLRLYDLQSYSVPDNVTRNSPGLVPIPFRGNTPKLRELVLGGVHFDWASARQMLRNLHSIEFLSNGYAMRQTFAEFCEMINHSPDLHTLILCVSGPEFPESGILNLPSLTLPNLNVLGLYDDSEEPIFHLLRSLDLPNLQSLTLDWRCMSDLESVKKELAEILRDKSILERLKSLRLWEMPWQGKVLKMVFDRLTVLESLVVICDSSVRTDEYLHLLKTGEELYGDYDGESEFNKQVLDREHLDNEGTDNALSTKLYCPKLKSLGTSTLNGRELKEIVQSRAAQGSPLKNVTVTTTIHDDHPSVDIQKWLTKNLLSFKTCPWKEETDWSFFDDADYESEDEYELQEELDSST